MKLYNERYKELNKAIKTSCLKDKNDLNKKVIKHRILYTEMILKLSTVL